MRILLSYGLVGRGGDAIQTLAIAEAFRQLGHDVELIGPSPLRPYEFAGTEGRLRSGLRRLPWWAKDFIELGLNLSLWFKTRRMRHQQSFDLVFHRAGIYDFVGNRLPHLTCCPLIVQLDAPFSIERAFRHEGHFSSLYRRCMHWLGQAAQLIVTVSAASKDHYVELGLPAEKMLVVPNGISSRLLEEGARLAQAHPPFSDSHICTIGFVGSLSPWHRVDILLQALSNLEDSYRVVIGGYGAEFRRLQALAKSLGVAERVSWLGALPHERAIKEIAQFDIAVLPGTLATGAPIKLFEYAALARPIIAPDLPNLRAWFDEEEVCFILPEDAEALVRAIRSIAAAPDRARTMGKKAQGRVREYTWERIVKEILKAAGFAYAV